jgi:hypothetical protein
MTLLTAKQITHGEICNKQQNCSHNFVVFSSVFTVTEPCTDCIFQSALVSSYKSTPKRVTVNGLLLQTEEQGMNVPKA